VAPPSLAYLLIVFVNIANNLSNAGDNASIATCHSATPTPPTPATANRAAFVGRGVGCECEVNRGGFTATSLQVVSAQVFQLKVATFCVLLRRHNINTHVCTHPYTATKVDLYIS